MVEEEKNNKIPPDKEVVREFIKKEFGELGVKVYQLVDGKSTSIEIMKKLNLSEIEVIKILEFFDENGIIAFDYPIVAVTEVNDINDDPSKTICSSLCNDLNLPDEIKVKSAKEVHISLQYKVYYNEGNKYFNQKNYGRAIENYTMSILSNPEFPECYFNRGLAYYYFYRFQNAISDFIKSISLIKENEDLSLVHSNLGCAYSASSEKNYAQALVNFNKSIELNPNYIDAYYNRGLCYANLRSYENAIEDLTKYINSNPVNPKGYRLRALFYECSSGNISELNDRILKAIKDYETALHLKPDLTETKYNLNNLKEKLKEPKKIKTSTEKELVDPSSLISTPTSKLADIAGMKNLKEIISSKILYPIKHKEKAEKYGKTFGGGMLFYGPPGCGKSYIVEAISGETEIKLIKANISDILNMWVGNSEKNLGLIFEEARENQPSIIFFDEIEALGGKREDMSQHFERTLVNQFLLEMDKIEKKNESILVVGATNSPWDVDHALRRSGRFTEIIFVEPPDLQTRVELFKMYSAKIKLLGRLNYEELAKLTEGFSSANIKFICNKASDNAWKEAVEKNIERNIEMDDFLNIISNERSDVKEWFEIAKGYSSNSLFKETYKELIKYTNEKHSDKKNENMFG